MVLVVVGHMQGDLRAGTLPLPVPASNPDASPADDLGSGSTPHDASRPTGAPTDGHFASDEGRHIEGSIDDGTEGIIERAFETVNERTNVGTHVGTHVGTNPRTIRTTERTNPTLARRP